MTADMVCVTLSDERSKLARKAFQLNARGARHQGLPPLVLMTDDGRDVDWVGAVRALPRGSAVIVRHRDAKARAFLARRLKPVCAARGVRLLIADDLKLAVRVRACGVHIPQARAEKILEARLRNRLWFVSASAHDHRSVRRAAELGADAILLSPVFATASHARQQGLGVVRLAALRRQAVYALGGIDAVSIDRLASSGVAGVALIGGWIRS